MNDKPHTPQDIIVSMAGEFCARMQGHGFSDEDIIYALEISIAGMRVISDLNATDPIGQMMKSMGFKKINLPGLSTDRVDVFSAADDKGRCMCRACVKRRAAGHYHPDEPRDDV